MKIIYIGGFPPPYGGVTIKNALLFKKLSENMLMNKIDLAKVKRRNLIELLRLVFALLNPRSCLVIGSSGASRKLFSKILYVLNRNVLRRSILIVMGGTSSKKIARDPKFQKWVSNYRQVFVETIGMKRELEDVGAENVSIYPNCRDPFFEKIDITARKVRKIKCVYFSKISYEKGADIVLKAAEIMKKRGIDFVIDFYGNISDDFDEVFHKQIGQSNRMNYFGIFKSDVENIYKKLQNYDVLLFPTRWKAEGVPGVLVESKFAGIPAIVSDICYNKEIIQNGDNGVLLKENTPEQLSNAIELLCCSHELLSKLKLGAQKSSEEYLINKYIDDIIMCLSG